MPLTFGSLFAGIGGFDLGFERAGMECKWQVEIDRWKKALLAEKWPAVQRINDVRQAVTEVAPATLFAEVTRALSTPSPAPISNPCTPTLPDTSLPWLEDFALNGWSARMFLHQLQTTLELHWEPSDTDMLLSASIAPRLLAKVERESSLSENIKRPGQAFASSFPSQKTVAAAVRRALERERSFRLLLNEDSGPVPVIVTSLNQPGSERWTLRSEKPLPDSRAAGLRDLMTRLAQEC
jgi:hypothetical protein